MSKNTTEIEPLSAYDLCRHAFNCVAEFHTAFGVSSEQCGPAPIHKRQELFAEELNETVQAVKRKDHTEFLDGICDMLYIASGSEHILCGACHSIMLKNSYTYVRPTPQDVLHYTLLKAKLTDNHPYILDIIHQAFNEVHRSNMSKLWSEDELQQMPKDYISDLVGDNKYSVRNQNSKICKPPSYSKPDLKELAAQLAEHINL